jgi:exodeoxyribonuclease V alpha subunit
MDYWGYNPNKANEKYRQDYGDVGDVDFLLEQAAASEDRVRQASHTIVVQSMESDRTFTIQGAGDVNNLIHGYAITVHKAQGSEWNKVYLALHQSHATMCLRELLYTAVTRAKEELYVICEPDQFYKGVLNQKIKGNTLEQKAEFFKGKSDDITATDLMKKVNSILYHKTSEV